jgi:cyanate permease
VAVTQASGEGNAPARTSRLLGVFREMLDFTPLTDCLFNCFMVAALMFRTGTTVFMMNVPSRAVSLGLPMGDAALLMSLISVGQISTHLPTSIAANFISSRARHIVVVVGMVLCGIPGLLSEAATTFASSAALSICFGLGLGKCLS